MHITLVAGARPNFMKIAPIIDEIKRQQQNGASMDYALVHTGQHYDEKLSKQFFDDLGIPKPDANLEVGSGSHAKQTAAIMVAMEEYLLTHPTDLVLVVGDVNSTMAAVIVAAKLHIKTAHVEAGIRSFDRAMPEEINRLATDAICDYFLTTSMWAGENLKKEGISQDQIFFVGNTMIDSLLKNQERLIRPALFDELGISEKGYVASTLHRPRNVDDPANLKVILNEIAEASGTPIVFPCHPRTRNKLGDLSGLPSNLHVVEPMSYLEFIYLIKHSEAVVTDSGGIQEETTVLGVPCMTLRDNTERPETCSVGTNELLGTDPSALRPAFDRLKSGNWKKGSIPDLWDGKASERIVKSILEKIS